MTEQKLIERLKDDRYWQRLERHLDELLDEIEVIVDEKNNHKVCLSTNTR